MMTANEADPISPSLSPGEGRGGRVALVAFVTVVLQHG
jgi:hypothetical protein